MTNRANEFLDMVETVDRGAWKIIKKGVAVIEPGRDKGICKKFSRICVKRGSELTELADLIVGEATNIRIC